jgi:hypothetical protein
VCVLNPDPPSRKAPSLVNHVCQGVALEMGAHVVADLAPYGEQNTLTFVVARAVLVGIAEVASLDWAVDGSNDLGQADLVGRPGKQISTAYATLGLDQPCTFQREQDLLQIWLGETGAFCDVSDRLWSERVDMERHGQQRSAGVVTSGRDLHVW